MLQRGYRGQFSLFVFVFVSLFVAVAVVVVDVVVVYWGFFFYKNVYWYNLLIHVFSMLIVRAV